jgi:DNA-dependent ATPase
VGYGLSDYKLEDKYISFNGITLGTDQIECAEYMLARKGCILGGQCGLGKTLITSVANKVLLDKYSTVVSIIVCPVKALKAFRRELFEKLLLKEDEVGIISADYTWYNLDTNRIFVCTDTQVEKLDRITAELKSRNIPMILNVDEAHKLQDKKSKFSMIMSNIRSRCSIVWLMTATPILNSLDSLYNIVNFSSPGFLGKKDAFDNNFTLWNLRDQYIKRGGKATKIKVKDVYSYKNLDILREKLNDIIIVRGKEYNLKFTALECDLSDKDYEIYKRVSSGILNFEDDARNFSRRMHDLQRFVDRVYTDETMEDLVSNYCDTEYSPKEELLLNSLEGAFSNGYSVIIYAEYKETISRLETILKKNKKKLNLGKIHKVTGSINIKVREAVEENIGSRDVVLITSAGTESVNLQKCNTIIFYDISFSTKNMIQAVGRVCRRDSKFDTQYAILLVTKRTIDEYKYRMFNNNLNMVKGAVGAGKDIPLSEDMLLSDANDLRVLKDELLWAYKGSKKRTRKAKTTDYKVVEKQLVPCTYADASGEIASYRFLVEPCISDTVGFDLDSCTKLYSYISDKEIPFAVIKTKYHQYLTTEEGKRMLLSLKDGALNKGRILLIGNNIEISKMIQKEVLKLCK